MFLSQEENYKVFTAVLDNGEWGVHTVLRFFEMGVQPIKKAYGDVNLNNAMIATATNVASPGYMQRVCNVFTTFQKL